MARTSLGVMFALIASALLAAQSPAGQPVLGVGGATGSGPVISQSDVTYLGYWDVLNVNQLPNSVQGFTLRHVGAELRFMTLQGDSVQEFSTLNKPFGSKITAVTRTWSNIGSGASDFRALTYDEDTARLWTTTSRNYTNGTSLWPTQISSRTLNDDLTVSNLRSIVLDQIPSRRVFGGMVPVPSWFQARYGVATNAVGWGGDTSTIFAAVGNASIGPTMYVMPDPIGYALGEVIPKGVYRVALDYSPANLHRGTRITTPINYMDGGCDARPGNSTTPPTTPPLPGCSWPTPRADGKSPWMIPDSNWGTCQWVDGSIKHGVLCTPTLWSGKVYYMLSDYWCDYLKFEMQVYDPDDIGRALLDPSLIASIEPTNLFEVNLPGLSDKGPKTHMTPGMGATGATWDKTTKTYYVLGLGINNFSTTNRIFAFRINA